VIAGDDIYGGTSRLLDQVLPGMGVDVTNVDHTNLNSFKRAFQPGRTKLVILESPTNPRMRVRPPCSASDSMLHMCWVAPCDAWLHVVIPHK
jgi:O-acetylhomoserine/O-acetylserine sulfhydrylase-like pyridoxal-dependent enzyme